MEMKGGSVDLIQETIQQSAYTHNQSVSGGDFNITNYNDILNTHKYIRHV